MARPLRIEYDGALYHVTSRGNDRKAIFKDDSDSRGKGSRDPLIVKAITDYGYSQMEVASFLGLHYSTISRIVADVGEQQK